MKSKICARKTSHEIFCSFLILSFSLFFRGHVLYVLLHMQEPHGLAQSHPARFLLPFEPLPQAGLIACASQLWNPLHEDLRIFRISDIL